MSLKDAFRPTSGLASGPWLVAQIAFLALVILPCAIGSLHWGDRHGGLVGVLGAVLGVAVAIIVGMLFSAWCRRRSGMAS